MFPGRYLGDCATAWLHQPALCPNVHLVSPRNARASRTASPLRTPSTVWRRLNRGLPPFSPCPMANRAGGFLLPWFSQFARVFIDSVFAVARCIPQWLPPLALGLHFRATLSRLMTTHSNQIPIISETATKAGNLYLFVWCLSRKLAGAMNERPGRSNFGVKAGVKSRNAPNGAFNMSGWRRGWDSNPR